MQRLFEDGDKDKAARAAGERMDIEEPTYINVSRWKQTITLMTLIVGLFIYAERRMSAAEFEVVQLRSQVTRQNDEHREMRKSLDLAIAMRDATLGVLEEMIDESKIPQVKKDRLKARIRMPALRPQSARPSDRDPVTRAVVVAGRGIKKGARKVASVFTKPFRTRGEQAMGH